MSSNMNVPKEDRDATAVDLILSFILPIIGVLIGLFALAKGERRRGMVMIGVGLVMTFVFMLFRRH